MSITKRTLKDGSRVYELRYPSGNNPVTGKPLPPYTERYKPPATWSDARAEREARRAEADFIARCKAGQVLTKAEQRQRRKEQAEAAERERREAAAKPTFQSYGEKWLKAAARAGEKAPGTINNYRIMLDRVNPVLGSYQLEDLTRSIMREYVEQLFTEGRDERTGEPLAYATKNRLFQLLSAFLDCAVEDGFIEVSPMLGVKKPKRPKSEQPTERKAFTAEEVQQIRAALDREPLMWKALVIRSASISACFFRCFSLFPCTYFTIFYPQLLVFQAVRGCGVLPTYIFLKFGGCWVFLGFLRAGTMRLNPQSLDITGFLLIEFEFPCNSITFGCLRIVRER